MGKGACEGELKRRHVISKHANPIEQFDRFKLSEVSHHNTPEDCWIIVKDKVYNVTDFAKAHPGGKVIYTYGGKDATDVFTAFHSPNAWKLLSKYHIGYCDGTETTSDLIADFRALRLSMVQNKMFDASMGFYVYKLACLLSILIAVPIILGYSQSWISVVISAITLALFYQQCGWLAHDFLHHQVFKWRGVNHVIGGYILGNLFQGFSGSWWLNKHNTHHAAPNECDAQYKAVDPDIDTLPFLAWSEDILHTVESPSVRSILRWQHVLFLPVLLLARLAWLYGSFEYVVTAPMSGTTRLWELTVLCCHYAAVIGGACWLLPVGKAVAFCVLAEMFGGLFLGLVFVQSHNGMEIYTDSKDFFTSQIVSTRDIKGSLFNDWFSGGLNRQLEHHLFPTLPRHNLKLCSQQVKAICQKHGLNFEDVGMVEGTRRVLARLAQVAALA